MLNIWKKCAVLTGVFTLMAAAALAPPKDAAETRGSEAADKARTKAQEKMSQSENSEMGQFVLEQLAAGKSGEDLADAIKAKQADLKKSGKDKEEAEDAEEAKKKANEAKAKAAEAREDAKEARAKAAEAKAKARKDNDKRAKVAKKHGLEDDDVHGMGAFVNAKLADGLRGQELSAAIKEELDRRKTLRQEAREEKKKDKAKGKNDKAEDKDDISNDNDRVPADGAKDKAKTKANDKNKGKPNAAKSKGNSGAAKRKPK